MLSLTNSNSQTPLSGQALTFDTVLLKTGCAECYQQDTGAATLIVKNAIYEIDFSSVVSAAATGDVQAVIGINGTPVKYSLMQSTIATAGNTQMISRKIRIKTCCCSGGINISIINQSEAAVEPEFINPILNIKRVA